MAERERVDAYLGTIDRFEPDIAHTDPSAYGTSLAVSAKRIADALEQIMAELVVIRSRLAPREAGER